jgi:hypothetical protein
MDIKKQAVPEYLTQGFTRRQAGFKFSAPPKRETNRKKIYI